MNSKVFQCETWTISCVFPGDRGLVEMIQGLNCVVSPSRQIS